MMRTFVPHTTSIMPDFNRVGWFISIPDVQLSADYNNPKYLTSSMWGEHYLRQGLLAS